MLSVTYNLACFRRSDSSRCHDQMVGRESNRAGGNEEEKQGENSARAKELFPCKRLVA